MRKHIDKVVKEVESMAAKDYIALTFIAACFLLILAGHNGVITGILIMVATHYFARRKI